MLLSPKSVPTLVVLSILTAVLLWGCGGEKNPAMSLQFFDRVFVLVDPSSLRPQDRDVGRIQVGDLQVNFVHAEADFGETGTATAIVLYSNVRYIPAGSAYMPIRVRTLYDAALDDVEAAGIVVNPGVPGTVSYTMSDGEIDAASPRIMEAKPLRLEILVAGG